MDIGSYPKWPNNGEKDPYRVMLSVECTDPELLKEVTEQVVKCVKGRLFPSKDENVN